MKTVIVSAIAATVLTPSLMAGTFYSHGQEVEYTPVENTSKVRSVTQTNPGFKMYTTPNNKKVMIGQTLSVALKPDGNAVKDINGFFESMGVEIVKTLGEVPYTYKVRPLEEGNVFGVARRIFESGEVKYAEPTMKHQIKTRGLSVNDPYAQYAWHLKNDHALSVYEYTAYGIVPMNNVFGVDIDIERAWALTTGEGQSVAVFDDGVDGNHEDLKDNISFQENCFDGSSNATPTAAGYENGDGHGTAVSGLIAAVGNNGKGSVGVAYNAKLMEYRIISEDYDLEWVNDEVIIAKMNEASKTANVINNSWGSGAAGDFLSAGLTDLATNGRNGKGTVIVFAAGNSSLPLEVHAGQSWVRDESNVPGVISVGSVKSDGERAAYSNYGYGIDIMAPVGDWGVVTTDATGTVGYVGDTEWITVEDENYFTFWSEKEGQAFGGTSAAAPVVAGACALILDVNPDLTAVQVTALLANTATKMTNLYEFNADGRNKYVGPGFLDAGAAVIAADAMKTLTSAPQDIDGHFVHYGDGAYDWVYAAADGSGALKLTGFNKNNGELTWDNLNGSYTVSGNNISFSGVTQGATAVNGKTFAISGHFVNYGTDAYDWAYVPHDGSYVARLDGIDDNGDLKWIMLDTPQEATLKVVVGTTAIRFVN